MRSFQHIYDFCNRDATYRAYYDTPEELICTGRVYKYYHGYVNDGHTRCGTYIFSQSRTQLDRFLGGQMESYHIHFNRSTGETVTDFWKHPHPEMVTYVTSYISSRGVRISYEHPFSPGFTRKSVSFTARSHRAYDEAGVIQEVLSHMEKNLLLPPGRYRDIQVKHLVRKEEFPHFYQQYRKLKNIQNEVEHIEMLKRYRRPLSYKQCSELLDYMGLFEDLNCEPSERDEIIMEVINLFNPRP